MQGPRSAAAAASVSRRVLAFALLALLLLPANALAQSGADDVAARRAAVAPVQTVFDAAARLVDRAIDEATRDGTPDEARKLLMDVQAYVQAFRRNLEVSEDATYRNLTLEAAPHAVALAEVLAFVPDDVARLATSAARCANEELTADELHELEAARLAANATGVELVELAAAAPADVDAVRLRMAGGRLSSWSTTFVGFVDCDLEPGADPSRPILMFSLLPGTSWPGGEVLIRGVTNVDGPLRVVAPTLDLDLELNATPGRITQRFQVPSSAALADHEVQILGGDTNATRRLAVGRAPSELIVEGPERVPAGANATFLLTLRSPLPAVTDRATVRVTGLGTQDVVLEEGRAVVSFGTPAQARSFRLSFVYEGDDVVAGDATDLMLAVAPPPVPIERDASLRDLAAAVGELMRSPLFVSVLLVVAVLGLAYLAWQLRRSWGARQRQKARFRGARKSVATHGQPTVLEDLPELDRLTLVPLFAWLARALRRSGQARPSTTAREMQPMLERLGVDAGTMVGDFERVRYGSRVEEESLTQRARAWFRDAWSRLTGVRG